MHKVCTALQGSAGEKKDSGYLGGTPSNLGVNEGGVLIHNADEQPEAKQRHSRTVNLGQIPYSGEFVCLSTFRSVPLIELCERTIRSCWQDLVAFAVVVCTRLPPLWIHLAHP